MANLSKQRVHAAFEYAGNVILSAAGQDGVTSRRDMRRELTNLSGAARELVESFYSILTHRAPNGRVDREAVESGVQYAKEVLVDHHDPNNNGLSRNEIEQMSATAKLAVEVARQGIPTQGAQPVQVADPCADASTELVQRIRELAEGLTFDFWGSEATNATLKLFHRGAELDELTRECFVEKLKLDPQDPRDEISRWTRSLTSVFNHLVEAQRDNQAKAKARDLIKLMREELRDVTGVIVGREGERAQGKHPVYIVGLANDGDMIGVQTHVIWT